jgi:hypothetical protein
MWKGGHDAMVFFQTFRSVASIGAFLTGLGAHLTLKNP